MGVRTKYPIARLGYFGCIFTLSGSADDAVKNRSRDVDENTCLPVRSISKSNKMIFESEIILFKLSTQLKQFNTFFTKVFLFFDGNRQIDSAAIQNKVYIYIYFYTILKSIKKKSVNKK